MENFKQYLNSIHPSSSGATSSYLKAINILDKLFLQRDVFNLNAKSLFEIKDPVLMARIIDYVDREEDKYRKNEDSIFDLGNPKQTSYPKKRFCTAAIHALGRYVNIMAENEAAGLMIASQSSGRNLSIKLIQKFQIDNLGSEREVRAKHRIGQDIFRALLLRNYHQRCCLTGIDIPEVLRASHIIPWSENVINRLNPENGLCLSATYDAAFDRHLISLDEDYRLILSPAIKDHYTSESFNVHFLKLEGRMIEMPDMYLPSQQFLTEHRNKLII